MATAAESGADEQALVNRVVASDDHSAFAELVLRHQSPVRQFLRRLSRQDDARADDLAQETFFRAYRRIASFRGEGRFRSWLFSIAYSIFLAEQKRYAKMSAYAERVSTAVGTTEADVFMRRTVDVLLGQLGPEERAAILLHYQHGMTHPEIADALAAPLGTVKTMIRRGRLKMRQHYESTEDRREERSADERR